MAFDERGLGGDYGTGMTREEVLKVIEVTPVGPPEKLVRHHWKAWAKLVTEARTLALDNYETWGNWVIECYTAADLLKELRAECTVKRWVKHRIRFHDHAEEIGNTAW